jgi:tetratricopeptide (TPR) repeat protein
LSKRVAAELHERFADWLAGAVGTSSEGFEAFLGYHLERAVRFRREVRPSDERATDLALRAADHLSASARAAGWRGDSAAAMDLLRRAVALRTPDDAALLDDLFELSAAERQHGDAIAEAATLDRAEREARRRGLPAQAARAAAGRILSEGNTDPSGFRPEDLRHEAKQAMALFAAAGDHAGLAQAWSYLGFCDQYDMKSDRMAEDFERAAGEAEIAGQERETLEFRANALVGHYFGWTPVDRGLRLSRSLLRDARDYRYPQCLALSVEGGFLAMRGEFDRARELNGRASAMAEEMGVEAVVHHAGQGRFEIETLAGNLDAVEDVLRQMCSLFERMQDAGHGSTFTAYLANTLADLGRFEDAEIEADRAEVMAPESDVSTTLAVSRARIKVLAARRDLEAAVAVGRRALRITESTESWDLEAGIRTDLAPVLQLAGLEEEAQRLAAEAVEMYERKGILVLAARARDVLASLSA